MAERQDILISLEAEYAKKIFAGEKQVELRRRPMNVAPGSTVWIYVKRPVGSLVGRARVEAVHSLSPATLWRRFGPVSGLSRAQFFTYFEGVSRGFVLVLEGAKRLKRCLSLNVMRELIRGFNPPQFFMRLAAEHPLLLAVPETHRS